jgi:imidazolonepropionase-like amidohydrolase
MTRPGILRGPAARALGALALGLPLLAADAREAQAAALVVHVERLLPVAGGAVADARVLVEGGRISAVGPASQVAVPAGARELRAAVATPGFIDVQSSAGLSGLRNVPAVRDQDEMTDPDQSALRALDAFDPRDPLLRFLLEHGVTLIQTGPGPANPIAGQAGLFRTHGLSADEMIVRFPSAMVFNLGESPKATYEEKRGASTRMGTAALIRARLLDGRHHTSLGRRIFGRAPAPDLGLEALGQVADGALPALFVASRADDILTALRLTRELGLQSAIADASEGYLVRDALAAAGVPVLAGPVMERVGTPESENASYENPALLAQAGIAVALRTGFEAYVPKSRVLLFEAAVAAANGLGPEAALRAITLSPAEYLRIEQDYGSIETGKVADLVLFDGDPFEYTTHVVAVVAGGSVVFEREVPQAALP